MITYVDTSTLIKLLIDEVGTTEAGVIWDEPDVLVSARIGHVEARAAMAAARRQGRISAHVFRNAVDGLEVLWSQLSIVEIDDDLVRLAGDLAATHGLRGYDAVHLAAAHLVGADVFSSADHRLCAAASSSGFHVANPTAAMPSSMEPAAIEAGNAPTAGTTRDSGVHGIPMPTTSEQLDGGSDGFRVSADTDARRGASSPFSTTQLVTDGNLNQYSQLFARGGGGLCGLALIAATSKPYATMPAFKQMLEREGLSSQVDLGLIGDEATARAKAQRFIDAGATELAIREAPGTPEEAERTRSFLKSLLED